MKCEICSELLEEYLDGELAPSDHAQVSEHLLTCTDCSAVFSTLAAEQEMFARYDREIEVPPFLWTRITAQSVSENSRTPNWITSVADRFGMLSGGFAAGVAIVAFAIFCLIGILNFEVPKERVTINPDKPISPGTEEKQRPISPQPELKPNLIVLKPKQRHKATRTTGPLKLDQSDVLSSDLGYLDIDERDTAKHIEQTQNLLRSIRNVPVSDGDEEIDVTYDKALSRRLLNENVFLRREAEMKAKFPTKTLLADLEPFLIDIANLPDRARPEDVRVIKERVQKTEIVAALLEYQDRSTNNR